jgi:hypothetical protein
MAFRPSNTITTTSIIVGNPVTGGTVPSVLTVVAPGVLGQTTATIASTFLMWNGTNFVFSPVGSGNMAIGNIITGGTPNEVLYTSPTGTLESDSGFTRDSSSNFQTIITSTDGTAITTGTFDATQFMFSWNDGGSPPTIATVSGNGGSAFMSWSNQIIDSRFDAASNRARVQYDTGTGTLSNAIYDATQAITAWTDQTVFTERRQTINFIRDTFTGATSNQSIMNLLNSSAQLKHTDSGSGVTSQLTLSGTLSQLHFDDGAVISDVQLDSSGVVASFTPGSGLVPSLILTTEATLDFTDGSMDAYFQASATQAKGVFDDGSSTTATMLLDVTQVDLRFINALSQTSYIHGEGGQITIRTDDPSGTSQSYGLYLTDSATMRWRLTTPNSPNGIFSVDSTGSHSYFNFSDGTGNIGSADASPTAFTTQWTDSSTITASSGLNGTSADLSWTDTTNLSQFYGNANQMYMYHTNGSTFPAVIGIIDSTITPTVARRILIDEAADQIELKHPTQVKIDSLAYMAQGQKVHRTPISDTDYVVLTTDYLISYVTLSTLRNVTLPAANASGAGSVYIIKDATGNANSNNIVITPAGGSTIDGAVSKTINTSFGFYIVCSDGNSNYEVI